MIPEPEATREIDLLKENLKKAPGNLRKLVQAFREGELGSRNPVVTDEWVKELTKYAAAIEKLLVQPTSEFISGRRIKA